MQLLFTFNKRSEKRIFLKYFHHNISPEPLPALTTVLVLLQVIALVQVTLLVLVKVTLLEDVVVLHDFDNFDESISRIVLPQKITLHKFCVATPT
jgi:hypothetical protein